jgi:hypothetical protein
MVYSVVCTNYNVKLIIVESVCSAELKPICQVERFRKGTLKKVSGSIERALAEVGVSNFTSNARNPQLVVSLGQKDRTLFH